MSTEKARWNGHSFTVSSSLIRTFDKLQISGSCETEEKTLDGSNYVDRKNGKPTETTFTAYLNAFTGCDVRNEALAFVEDAKAGKKDYLYVGGIKLFEYEMMLTSASVVETEISSTDVWTKANIQLTFKQTGAGGTSVSSDGSGSSGGGVSGGTYSSSGSVKASVYTSNTVKKTVYRRSTTNALTGSEEVKETTSAVANANALIQKSINAAKNYTAKILSGGGGGRALFQVR